MPSQQITLTRPDDWHLHLRDGAVLARAALDSARCFARALVMPNLQTPVATVAQAAAYRESILAALPEGSGFEPLMSLYLTDVTPPEEIDRAAESGFVHAVKLYPAGATTHSSQGVRDLDSLHPILERMQERDLPLLIHGEVTDPQVDVFDRERVFIDRHLTTLTKEHPALRMVLEHVSTEEGVAFVRSAPATVAATITAHHLLLNRNALFDEGFRPHHYCLPVVKREEDRQAILAAATGGEPCFFLGTDSAPHLRSQKEGDAGRAGIYTAPVAIELYAEVFEAAGCLERLEAFASFFGADFYRLPRNTSRLQLEAEDWSVPDELPVADAGSIVPFRAGESLRWRLAP